MGTREEWLRNAVNHVGGLYLKQDYHVPDVNISVGWPFHATARNNVIGETWVRKYSKDKTNHIFVSPIISDPVAVLGIIGHELAHAIDDCKSGHSKTFQNIVRSIGYIPPWTSSILSPELEESLKGIAYRLGSYPHSSLDFESQKKDKDKEKAEKKTQTGLRKFIADDCGYTVWLTKKNADQGDPYCPHKIKMKPYVSD